MALEIKITPTLEGKNAERFLKLTKNAKSTVISKRERENIQKISREILKKAII